MNKTIKFISVIVSSLFVPVMAFALNVPWDRPSVGQVRPLYPGDTIRIASTTGRSIIDGNLNIGTTTMSARLGSVSDVDTTPALWASGGLSGFPIAIFSRVSGSPNNPTVRISGEGGNPQMDFISGALKKFSLGVVAGSDSFRIAPSNAVGTGDAFTILPTGKTGIGAGATNPVGDLSVVNSTAGSQVGVHINNTSNTGYSALRLGNDAVSSAGAALHHFNSSYPGSGGAYSPSMTTLSAFDSGGLSLQSNNGGANAALRFFTGGNASTFQRGMFDVAGRFAVGSSTPTAFSVIENVGGEDSFVVSDVARDTSPFSVGSNGGIRVNANASNSTTTAENTATNFAVYPTPRGTNLDSIFAMTMSNGGNRKISWVDNRIQAEFANGAGGGSVIAPAGINFMPVLSTTAGIGIGTTTNQWDGYLTIQGTTTTDTGEQIATYNSGGMKTFSLTDAGSMNVDNGVLYVDGSGRRVAVGHTSPNSQTVFHSINSQNVSSGSWQAGRFDAQSAPNAPSSATITGILAIGQHQSSATAGNTSGSITGVSGVGRSDSANTTVLTSDGVVGQVWQLGTGTTTNGSALKAVSPSITGGSITNSFGVNITAQKITGVTNGYGIFQSGASDINYFNGNIGVGTINPTSTTAMRKVLQIEDSGTNGAEMRLLSNSGTVAGRFFNNGSSLFGLGTDSNHDLMFFTNTGANERARITNTGNLGIGTTTPQAKLEITTAANDGIRISRAGFSGAYNLLIQAPQGANNYSAIGINGASALNIQGDGNIGIASTSPVEKLSVTGNALVTGSVFETGNYGEIWVEGSAVAQSIPTGATYTKITAFDTNGNVAGNVTADQANDKLTINRRGTYKVDMHMAFSDGANVTWDCSVFQGGTESRNIHFTRKLGTSGDIGSAGDAGFIRVTTTPLDIDLRCKHDSGVSQNITVQDSTLTAHYVGE